MMHGDWMELKNKFKEQCLLGNFDIGGLPLPNSYFSLLGLKQYSTTEYDLTNFVTGDYDESHTIEECRKEVECPVFGCMYTQGTCKFTLRKYENTPTKHPNIDYMEFKLANTFAQQYCNFMLLCKHRNFNDLSTYVAAQLPQEDVFCNMSVDPGLTGYDHYIQSVQRLFPTTWLTYYIDLKLAKLYLGQNFIEIINTEINMLLKLLVKQRSVKHKGNTTVTKYRINNTYFLKYMWDVKVICPGVLVGYTPGLLIYGNVLHEIMSEEEPCILGIEI